VFVDGLTTAQADDQSSGKQPGERRHRLGDHGRMITVTRSTDDAERHIRDLHGCAEPRERIPRMPLPFAPRVKVVRGVNRLEAALSGQNCQPPQLFWCELLVRRLPPNDGPSCH
jgi:hypothetical protein